jgi:hypothetical protein
VESETAFAKNTTMKNAIGTIAPTGNPRKAVIDMDMRYCKECDDFVDVSIRTNPILHKDCLAKLRQSLADAERDKREMAEIVIELVEWAQSKQKIKCENKYLQKATQILGKDRGEG